MAMVDVNDREMGCERVQKRGEVERADRAMTDVVRVVVDNMLREMV